MPELPTFDSPLAARGLQPSSLGVSGYEEAARSFREAGSSIGNAAEGAINVYEQHQEQQDLSSLTSDFGNVFAQATMSWNQTAASADPNDPNTAQKWRDNVLAPLLEKLGENVESEGGQRKAAELRTQLSNHFLSKTISDQGVLAGAAVQSNITQAGNAISQAAEADPTSMPAGLSILNNLIEDQIKSHALDPEQAARIRTEFTGPLSKTVATSAFRGMAERNPDAAVKALDSGTFGRFFNGDEAASLRTYARTQGNVNDELVRRQNKESADGDLATLQAKTIAPDGSIVIPKTFLGDVQKWLTQYGGRPGVENAASQARTMIDFARGVMKDPKTISDPHVYGDFSSRLTLSSDDPSALTDEQVVRARADGLLSNEDYNFFRGAISTLQKDPGYKVAQTQFKTFLKGIRSSITHSNILMGSNDPTGDQKFLQFQQAATAQFESAYHKGDGSWQNLLDRNTKGSLWFQAVPYMTDQKGATSDLLNRVTGAPGLVPSVQPGVKWKPGMSMDDLAKQLGGGK